MELEVINKVIKTRMELGIEGFQKAEAFLSLSFLLEIKKIDLKNIINSDKIIKAKPLQR